MSPELSTPTSEPKVLDSDSIGTMWRTSPVPSSEDQIEARVVHKVDADDNISRAKYAEQKMANSDAWSGPDPHEVPNHDWMRKIFINAR